MGQYQIGLHHHKRLAWIANKQSGDDRSLKQAEQGNEQVSAWGEDPSAPDHTKNNKYKGGHEQNDHEAGKATSWNFKERYAFDWEQGGPQKTSWQKFNLKTDRKEQNTGGHDGKHKHGDELTRMKEEQQTVVSVHDLLWNGCDLWNFALHACDKQMKDPNKWWSLHQVGAM